MSCVSERLSRARRMADCRWLAAATAEEEARRRRAGAMAREVARRHEVKGGGIGHAVGPRWTDALKGMAATEVRGRRLVRQGSRRAQRERKPCSCVPGAVRLPLAAGACLCAAGPVYQQRKRCDLHAWRDRVERRRCAVGTAVGEAGGPARSGSDGHRQWGGRERWASEGMGAGGAELRLRLPVQPDNSSLVRRLQARTWCS